MAVYYMISTFLRALLSNQILRPSKDVCGYCMFLNILIVDLKAQFILCKLLELKELFKKFAQCLFMKIQTHDVESFFAVNVFYTFYLNR